MSFRPIPAVAWSVGSLLFCVIPWSRAMWLMRISRPRRTRFLPAWVPGGQNGQRPRSDICDGLGLRAAGPACVRVFYWKVPRPFGNEICLSPRMPYRWPESFKGLCAGRGGRMFLFKLPADYDASRPGRDVCRRHAERSWTCAAADCPSAARWPESGSERIWTSVTPNGCGMSHSPQSLFCCGSEIIRGGANL